MKVDAHLHSEWNEIALMVYWEKVDLFLSKKTVSGQKLQKKKYFASSQLPI